ncbi:Glycogen debranching enzyme [Toxocara canis]|nr:Glycogen debranching enzyme [Toxocara canis]
MPVLNRIRENNDLGHPLCCNLRDGVWLCEYIVNRLTRYEPTKELGHIVERMFEPLKSVQHYLRPCYFEAIFSRLYNATREELRKKLHPSLSSASKFVRALALSSVSFMGGVGSAKLAPLSASIKFDDYLPSSLAAGLPHFSIGIWRNWGRDTFIALPGCLLVTGRFSDARNLILSYGGAMRHGLIPNLLAEGQGSRYNCRDAVWFWLHAIVKYIQRAPDGVKILHDKVLRLYPFDEAVYGADQKEEELHETMFDALKRHFEGIYFRERNAGGQIDEHMNDDGFNVAAYVNRETGFICGGNQWNCGTWMDKMGSSDRAGNRGFPATPRDGAAVELQGLAFAVLEYLDILHKKGLFPHWGVSKGSLKWSWADWASKLKANFERCFFVDDDDKASCVNRRYIVKDSFGSSAQYTDYQLRPNFTIALAVAPKLMSAKNAWKAICIAEEVLLGPLGIKTLDPKDWNYNGFYNNDEDSIVKKTAKGWNYHQGPEWLWVAAYFLRAKLLVAKELNDAAAYDAAVRSVRARMGTYWEHIQSSPWRSLPELTNENGAFCAGSCSAQAWSIGCLLETVDQLYDYH